MRPVANPPRRLVSRRALLALAALSAAGIGSARAQPAAAAATAARVPAELADEWPSARLQGQGRLRAMGFRIYDIRLWAPREPLSPDDWGQRALALEIEYARSLVGRLIAERSLQEMRRAGPMAPELAERWLQAMSRWFPDVQAGDRITGVHLPEGVVRFFANGAPRGELRDAEFARRFFGIWLAPHTSEPRLRDALLGLS
jgi:hypothetical protein